MRSALATLVAGLALGCSTMHCGAIPAPSAGTTLLDWDSPWATSGAPSTQHVPLRLITALAPVDVDLDVSARGSDVAHVTLVLAATPQAQGVSVSPPIVMTTGEPPVDAAGVIVSLDPSAHPATYAYEVELTIARDGTLRDSVGQPLAPCTRATSSPSERTTVCLREPS